MATTSYLIGLGSNRRHGRHGSPEGVLRAALVAIDTAGVAIVAASPAIRSVPLGPSARRFANAAVLVRAPLDPPALLVRLKAIERDFGRRRGRRWGVRVLDLDILAWDGGRWPRGPVARHAALLIPHPALAVRRFALDPAAGLAPRWRIGGRTIAQAAAILRQPRPVDRPARRP